MFALLPFGPRTRLIMIIIYSIDFILFDRGVVRANNYLLLYSNRFIYSV